LNRQPSQGWDFRLFIDITVRLGGDP
jgi:hypothetical protein